MFREPGWSIASPGMCLHAVSLSDPCADCLRVSDAINGEDLEFDRSATVHVECALCENRIEVRSGCAGIDDALSAGWSFDASHELLCVACTEARADLVGEES